MDLLERKRTLTETQVLRKKTGGTKTSLVCHFLLENDGSIVNDSGSKELKSFLSNHLFKEINFLVGGNPSFYEWKESTITHIKYDVLRLIVYYIIRVIVIKYY